MLNMFYYSFYDNSPKKEGLNTIEEGIQQLLKRPEIKTEITEILQYNYNNLKLIEVEHDFNFTCPLGIHSKYTTAQIMAAFGYYNQDANPASEKVSNTSKKRT